MRRFLKYLLQRFFPDSALPESRIPTINLRRAELAGLSDDELKAAGLRASDLVEVFAVTAVVAARVLGLQMFDVQLQGALALANGRIAGLQTGEGKTLAPGPSGVWNAKESPRVPCMTGAGY